jgi:hypothetical protein
MFAREGSWGVSSKKDPRWNGGGRSLAAGIFCPEVDEHVMKMKELLKEEPPDDLEGWSYKD